MAGQRSFALLSPCELQRKTEQREPLNKRLFSRLEYLHSTYCTIRDEYLAIFRDGILCMSHLSGSLRNESRFLDLSLRERQLNLSGGRVAYMGAEM